jgi:hypothetical protein
MCKLLVLSFTKYVSGCPFNLVLILVLVLVLFYAFLPLAQVLVCAHVCVHVLLCVDIHT